MADSPKTFDVSRPGKSSPDASSKPLIVTNKPEVKDPMVAAGVVSSAKPASEETKVAEPETAEEEEAVIPGSSRPKIAPLTDKEKTDAGLAPEEGEPKEKTDEQKAAQDSAIVDAVAEQADAKKAEKKADEEGAVRQEAVQKLIDAKEYVVPIGIESGKKKSSSGLIAFLVLLLILAVGYLALDAGILKIDGVEVPYHILGK